MSGVDYYLRWDAATTATNRYSYITISLSDSIDDLVNEFWKMHEQADQFNSFREFRKAKLFTDITRLNVVKPEIRKANQRPTFWWEAWQS